MRVDPVLRDIYICKLDRAVMVALTSSLARKRFVYVEDFLVIHETHSKTDVPQLIKKVIWGVANRSIRYTQEVAMGASITFLELALSFFHGRVCRAYIPTSRKRLLSFRYSRTKIVKLYIIVSFATSAITRSCSHLMVKALTSRFPR